MAHSLKPPRFPVATAWLIVLAPTILVPLVAIWLSSNEVYPLQAAWDPRMTIRMVLEASAFQAIAAAVFLIMLLTNGLTFRFDRPAWDGARRRIGIANLVIWVGVMLGSVRLMSSFGLPILYSM